REQSGRVARGPLEARVQRGGERLADLAALGWRQPNFGADIDIGLQRLQHAAEIALALAVAIHLRRVEIIDAELDGARNSAFLIGGGALDHEPADRATAEAEQRDVETGSAKLSLLHRRLLVPARRPISPPARPACQLSGKDGALAARIAEAPLGRMT